MNQMNHVTSCVETTLIPILNKSSLYRLFTDLLNKSALYQKNILLYQACSLINLRLIDMEEHTNYLKSEFRLDLFSLV